MMKKITWLFLFIACWVNAQTFNSGGLKYTVFSGTTNVSVAHVPNACPTGAVILPSIVSNAGTNYTVTSIAYFAFRDCRFLNSITIPNSVTSINDQAFYNCQSLSSVTIPNSVTSIAALAFYNCQRLSSVTIPNSVTSIGERTFAYCTGLTSLTIPNSITSIPERAFIVCTGLTSVSIPNSVTAINNEAFSDCRGLTSLIIPNSVTAIGTDAFSFCTSLASVTIPNSVTSIGDGAFYNCKNLTSVTCLKPTPVTINADVFGNMNQGACTLRVPAGSVAAYDAAPVWTNFLGPVALPNAPTAASPQSFCSAAGATLATVVATPDAGGAINWYDAATAGSLLANTTALVDGTTYYTSQTVSGFESPTRTAVLVTINATPTVSAGTAPTQACPVTNVTLTGTSSLVQNGFTGSLAPANWVFSNTNADGTINTSSLPNSIALTGGNNGSNMSGTTSYTVTTPASGTISFNWDYTTIDTAVQQDYPRILLDGNITAINGFDPSGAQSQSGTMSVNVLAGQTFTFLVVTGDNTFGAATTVFSNLVYTTGSTNWSTTNGTLVGATNGLTATASSAGTYTLTATSPNGCVATSDVVVTYLTPTTPSFTQVAAICAGATLAALPTNSNNTTAITGTWSPALNNTATTTYTFTPTASECATTATMTINVNDAPTVSAGTAPTPTCPGTYITLTGTSSISPLNGTLQWSTVDGLIVSTTDTLSIVIALSGTYTLTATSSNGCVATSDVVVTYLTPIVPTFTQVAPICAGTTLANLPTSSNDATAITGAWSPAINNTATTEYTFTPDQGQCATETTMIIVVNATPTVSAGTAPTPACPGTNVTLTGTSSISKRGFIDTLAPANWTLNSNNVDNGVEIGNDFSYLYLPVSSNNSSMLGNMIYSTTIQETGTLSFDWQYATDQPSNYTALLLLDDVDANIGLDNTVPNTQSGVKTLAVTAGQQLEFIINTTNINNDSAATFYITNLVYTTALAANWSTTNGTLVGATNGLTATASSAGTYILTATSGAGCVATSDVVVTYLTPTTPTFNQVTAICSGATLAALPTSSNNTTAITGTWSPALNNTATTTYTFTPAAGECATTTTMTVTVNAQATPTFTQVAAICAGATLAALPTSSNDATAITGTWSPAINNTATTTYTFTPAASECATTATMTIDVNAAPTVSATATPTEACQGNNVILTGTTSVIQKGFTGSFKRSNWQDLRNSGGGNVYVPFNTTNSITMISGNNGSNTPGRNDYQITIPKNGTISFNWSYNSITNPSNDYPQVYLNTTAFPITGFNYISGFLQSGTMTIAVLAGQTFAFSMATTDNLGGHASASFENLVYTTGSVNWSTTNGTLVGATNGLTATASSAGTYTLTATSGAGCVSTSDVVVTYLTPTTPTFTQVAAICAGATLAALPTSSNNTTAITGTWSPALNNTATTTYTFTPAAGECATTTTMTIAVNTLPTVSAGTAPTPVCPGTNVTLTGTSSAFVQNGFTGSLAPANWVFNPSSPSNYLNFNPNQTEMSFSFLSNSGSPQAAISNYSTTISTSGTISFNWTCYAGFNAFAYIPEILINGSPTLLTGYNTNSTTTQQGTMTVPVIAGQTFSYAIRATNTGVSSVATLSIGNLVYSNGSTNWSTTNGTLVGATNVLTATASSAGTYTLTATSAAGCVATSDVVVEYLTSTTPTFTQVAAICAGATLAALPTSSNNATAIIGNWSPAINNSATTTYTFTPAAGECATTATMTVTVNAQPAQPTLACYESATFNTNTCTWVVTATQPTQPTVACYESATFNTNTCAWVVTGTQPTQPTLACYESATFNTNTCAWVITGTQPTQPTLACYESATFNTTTCAWVVTGTQPTQPTLACYESATFNTNTCAWVVSGTQPTQPTLACYESATFNTNTCAWVVSGTQPTQPTLACYETATFNTNTCAWVVTGTQPTQPTLACYESATFNTNTCAWVVTGTPIAAPTAAATQSVLTGATIANLSATGTAIQWYATATSTTALPTTTVLVSGTTLYASQTINGCESARTAVLVDIPLANNDFEFTSKLSVYPNPFTNVFTIAIDTDAKIEIFDMVGKFIQSKNIVYGENVIDMDKYATGVYLLKITNTNNQVKTVKVTKR